jgi:hypothetical protein
MIISSSGSEWLLSNQVIFGTERPEHERFFYNTKETFMYNIRRIIIYTTTLDFEQAQ